MTRQSQVTDRNKTAPTASDLTVIARSDSDNISKRRTFVLVHGAWHGGWCWKKVAPLLREVGHDVFTPTLTGLGERSHLLSPEIDLNTHIQDVVAVLEHEDLRNVILVGHSYAGMVIAGVAARAARSVKQLVYLDAFVPDDGKALSDYWAVPPQTDGQWRLPPPAEWMFDITSKRDIAWVKARLGDQPCRTFTEPVQLGSGWDDTLASSYIQCSDLPCFAEAGERARARGFRYRELFSAGHDAMVTKPKQLVTLLLDAI